MSSSLTEKEHQKTTQSTLQVYFRGIRRGELLNRQHHVSITLPEVMFDVPDASLVQYTLFVLSGGKNVQRGWRYSY